MDDLIINGNKDAFCELIAESKTKKCCIIDTASVISGIAKQVCYAIKKRNAIIDTSVFIWFVVMLFVKILKNETECHGNKIFICVIRECSIIPKDILCNIGLKPDAHYICRILHKMKSYIQNTLDDSIFKIFAADTKSIDCKHSSEVDDAVCILLSSLMENSHILTCDGYNSFRPQNNVTFSDIIIKNGRGGNKFKSLVSLYDVNVTSRKCHVHHAQVFREKLKNMCSSTNYMSMYLLYLKSINP
jgi:hypothetical protein